MISTIAYLKNPVQQYAWGSKTMIQSLVGLDDLKGTPVAELWMGAHPKAPSMVQVNGNKWLPLNEVIKMAPFEILGKDVVTKFGDSLPFLFKLLAAKRPLSIQVHPNLDQAREGFERENALHIPLDSPKRNYRDKNHKPEILCALSPFEALKGFRRPEEIIHLMKQVIPSHLTDQFNKFCSDPAGQLRDFYSFIMTMERKQQKEAVEELVSKAERCIKKDVAFKWIIRLNNEYPGDIGVISPVLLNLVRLEPGQAIYIPAGELHSYLNGFGIELMANSDNVLRGGLTPKHVDVEELLWIVDFRATEVAVIEPESVNTKERSYVTPAREFLLSVVSLKKGDKYKSPQNRSVEILICTEGELVIQDNAVTRPLNRGQAVIVPAVVSDYRVEGAGVIYRASTCQRGVPV
ncbi:MAG: mannose-6-phosphate isomerase, class I [Deltaproteobacteria bacterium]|nr:mannose-6-phosphate isomerase, class I [Deltaproteobacteria bacterium]